DFATSLGPLVVTPDEFDGRSGTMLARVNGEERSRGNLADMHHTWEAIVAHAAQNTRLLPGDVLGSGTVGTGCILEHGDGRWLQPGDVVEPEVDGIGGLRNRGASSLRRGHDTAVAQRAAIIGAGVMGLAAARSLARRGWAVTIYEQFELGHRLGSSHGRSRIFRLAYPDATWVRMATESLRGWRELEQECGTDLLELNGLVEVVRDAGRSSRDGLRDAGAEFELLDAPEAQRRWPIHVPDGWTVLFQPEAG